MDHTVAFKALKQYVNTYDTATDLAQKKVRAAVIVNCAEDLFEALERAKTEQQVCDDAYHRHFKNAVFQDDTSIHIWRDAWKAALEHKEE